ncbi:MAG: hypothetical protein J3K34DRAFT_415726 [Monoraphidium minutum]|nr:MAG: hypothetical protein J3K34DRAFT_415726 [Monoraphidium minutum]
MMGEARARPQGRCRGRRARTLARTRGPHPHAAREGARARGVARPAPAPPARRPRGCTARGIWVHRPGGSLAQKYCTILCCCRLPLWVGAFAFSRQKKAQNDDMGGPPRRRQHWRAAGARAPQGGLHPFCPPWRSDHTTHHAARCPRNTPHHTTPRRL